MSGILRSRFTYFEESTGQRSERLFPLLKGKAWSTNPEYQAKYLSGKPTWPLTFVKGIRKEAIEDHRQIPASSFPEAIQSYFEGKLNPGETVNVALSGGLDSQFLLLWLKERGFQVQGLFLSTQIAGYCEGNKVLAFAEKNQVPVTVFEADRASFYEGLKDLLGIVEEPVYNLHAVSKFLLARKLSAAGIRKVVTGDGADQVFRGERECDLFRFTLRSFEAQDLELLTPLASEQMVSFVGAGSGDVDKRELYRMSGEKTSCFFPDEGKDDIFRLSLRHLQELTACAE